METVTQQEMANVLNMPATEQRLLLVVGSLPESSQAIVLQFAERAAACAGAEEMRTVLDNL